MPTHNYKELKVWQKSIAFAQVVYQLSLGLPAEERFGMISQLRRAAVSISVNIAEGSGRTTNKDFVNFLAIAYGSSLELETLLILCKNLGYISEQKFGEAIIQINEIQKMLNGLSDSFKQ